MLTVIVIVAIVALLLDLMRDRRPQLRRRHPSNREGPAFMTADAERVTRPLAAIVGRAAAMAASAAVSSS
jgi:hypothetical protein